MARILSKRIGKSKGKCERQAAFRYSAGCLVSHGKNAQSTALIDFARTASGEHYAPSCDQVSFQRSADDAMPGLVVSIATGGAGYPGVGINPQGPAWNLSPFGHVEARIANPGKLALAVNLRVDNADAIRITVTHEGEVTLMIESVTASADPVRMPE